MTVSTSCAVVMTVLMHLDLHVTSYELKQTPKVQVQSSGADANFEAGGLRVKSDGDDLTLGRDQGSSFAVGPSLLRR